MGRSDSQLTSNGIATALRMAEIVRSEGIETIFSSCLGRAAFTAALYSEQLGVQVHFRASMAELACGSWEGQPRLDVTSGSGALRTTWEDRPPGGESYQDAEPRVGKFIEEILDSGFAVPILVVGHASVNRVFLRLFLGLDKATAMRVSFPHDTLYIIQGRKEILRRDATGRQRSGLLFETD